MAPMSLGTWRAHIGPEPLNPLGPKCRGLKIGIGFGGMLYWDYGGNCCEILRPLHEALNPRHAHTHTRKHHESLPKRESGSLAFGVADTCNSRLGLSRVRSKAGILQGP